MTVPATRRSIGATVQAWLLGRGVPRGTSARARWLHAGLTATLLVTGVAAWALAIVQPWKARAADPGIVAVKGPLMPDRVRAVARASEASVKESRPPPVRPLCRDPFRSVDSAEGSIVARAACMTREGKARPAPAGAGSAEQIVEIVKSLTLKATILAPTGERWAIINGETYREGDRVAGLTLVEVREERARLQRAGVTCMLRMD